MAPSRRGDGTCAAIVQQRRDVFRVGDRLRRGAAMRPNAHEKKPQRSQSSHKTSCFLCVFASRQVLLAHRAKSAMKQPTACVVACGDRLAGDDRGQRVEQIALRRRRPLASEIDVAIVDAAAIHDLAADDDRRLGRDRRAGELDQRQLRIAQRLRTRRRRQYAVMCSRIARASSAGFG